MNAFKNIIPMKSSQEFKTVDSSYIKRLIYEPVHEKTNNLVFRPGLIQTRLYSHRSRLEA